MLPRCIKCEEKKRECRYESFTPMFYYANSQVHESVPVRSLSPRRPVEHNDLQMRERVMHAAIVQSKNYTKSQGHRDPAIGCNSPVSSDPTQPQYELLHCIPLAGDIGPNFNGYARGSAFPLTSKRRAILLRHFMDNLSPLYDATNTDEDFRRTVPARAGDHPILLYSLLTLSSRHLAFLNGVDSLEAEELYNESLNLLIPILNNPEAMADETILASAVLLRLYEELTAPYTGSDEENHLSGINLYISALKKQHDSSKHTHLAQTVFDVFLRQDLYTSIRNSHPLKLKTGYYPLDIPAYLQGRSKEHCQWATCAVRIVAHIANFCFDQVVKDVKEWRHLQNYLQTWRERCPALFTPYYYEEEKGEGEASYPQMWLWQIWHSMFY